MELDQLRYFVCTAEHLNMTRAAEELNLSQSALSRSIQKLEEELGQPVFERTSRSLTLTESGKFLVGRATQILTLVENTKSEITDDGQTGEIRVGAIPTIAPYFIPDLLRDFSDGYPRATIIVQEETTDRLIKSCSQGEIDLAIVAMPVTTKYLEVDKLFEEELLLVLPPLHPLATQGEIRVSDIRSLPFVLLDEAHCLSENIESFCHQQSFQPVTVERTSQLAMVQELVSLSHGVSMIPRMAEVRDQTDRRIYRSFSGARPTRTIAVVWNPYRFQSRLLAAFRARLRIHVETKFKAVESG